MLFPLSMITSGGVELLGVGVELGVGNALGVEDAMFTEEERVADALGTELTIDCAARVAVRDAV